MNVLNILLSNVCPKRTKDDLRLFVLDLHCNTMWIVAKFTPNTEEETYEYEILGYKIQGSRLDSELNTWAEGYFND